MEIPNLILPQVRFFKESCLPRKVQELVMRDDLRHLRVRADALGILRGVCTIPDGDLAGHQPEVLTVCGLLQDHGLVRRGIRQPIQGVCVQLCTSSQQCPDMLKITKGASNVTELCETHVPGPRRSRHGAGSVDASLCHIGCPAETRVFVVQLILKVEFVVVRFAALRLCFRYELLQGPSRCSPALLRAAPKSSSVAPLRQDADNTSFGENHAWSFRVEAGTSLRGSFLHVPFLHGQVADFP
mmetsp:Transcript_63814/g.149590  ORF Transcript_63814/g.149590 Transcript_63814/m.149590 type:complete len:242 (-) Transcript_63814:368-1093(-)